jgi:DNA polymerase III delta subunit
VQAISSVGFFAEKRIVVVTDLLARAAKPGKQPSAGDDADDVADRSSLDLAPLFGAVPVDNLLVLIDETLASVPAKVKKALPDGATIITAEPPRGHALIAWLVRRAEEAGSRIDAPTARFLAERVYPQSWSNAPSNPLYDQPPDLERLGNEIDKLALAANPDPIGRQHILESVVTGDDDRLFGFIEAVTAGNLPTALAELEKLRAAGEDPHKLAAQVYGQIELGTVLEAAGSRADPVGVGRALGLTNPNRMRGIAGGLRNNRHTRAATALHRALDIDRRLKRGELRDPEDMLVALTTVAIPNPRTVRLNNQSGDG